MNSQSSSKINNLLRTWPRGAVAVHSWLDKQGIYRQLADTYERSGWIQRIGRGAFKRGDDKIDWKSGLYAIQEQLGFSVHAGGKTALQLQGYAHFLPLGKAYEVVLFGTSGTRLPSWFWEYDWGVKIRYTQTNLFSADGNVGLTEKEVEAFFVKISAPERAIMEVLYAIDQNESFGEAKLLMEGLTTLRPGIVTRLLEGCPSIKVKRLFMFFAEEVNHGWVKKVNLSGVDFGKGKRVIAGGGHFSPKYEISVPEITLKGEGEDSRKTV